MTRGFLNKSGSKQQSKPLNPKEHVSVQESLGAQEQNPSKVSNSDEGEGDFTNAILDLHKPPASLVAQAGKTRFVFRKWPRNPEGPIISATPKGKEASNGLPLWGATLYDFYYVHRLHKIQGSITLTTGSKLTAHMREIGELDWAVDEIDWASREDDPAEVAPCDIGELIKDREYLISRGICGTSMKRVDAESTQHTVAPEETSQSFVPVFDLSNYPSPWPLVPFSTPALNLQERIPFHLLPRKLIVHDPWNLLLVDQWAIGKEDKDTKWTSKDDIIRTYQLKLSTAGEETVKKELKLRAELDAKCKDIDQREGFATMPNSQTSGPVSPVIMAFPPLCPPPPEYVPEAHLYLSPAHYAGTGNHSVVYNAEWELPRSMLVKDILCQKCMDAKVAEELEKRGEYHSDGVKKNGNAEDSSETVAGESSQSAATLDQTSSAKISITDEHLSAVKATFIFPKDLEAEKKDADDERGNDKSLCESHTIEPTKTIRTMTYEGPVVKVFPEVEWQNPERGPYCPHVRCKNVPLTAKVGVAAKLSNQYDAHLGREAKNYQSFPAYLFEHWNGYNLIPPLHDPVPLGAVVPQFYGHYVPEDNEENKAVPYLSPILLLENCGIPIDPEGLNQDDKHECTSLLYRMHEAGWNHGSYAARNILVQHGPLSQWPTFRPLNEVKSFRLIDFGRSSECSSSSRKSEEIVADQLFHTRHW